MKKYRMILCNIGIILVVVFIIVIYVHRQQTDKWERARNNFLRTTKVMEDVVSSDILAAQKLCENRAKYINANAMTMDEAIAYVRKSQSSDVSGHIVRLDTMEGRSTSHRTEDVTNDRVSYAKLDVIDRDELTGDDTIHMTKIFINPMDGTEVVAFYNKINLVEAGVVIPSVLMRLVQVETLKRQWMFSAYYPEASLVLMERDGDYVVKPSDVKGGNFFDSMTDCGEKKAVVKMRKEEIETNQQGGFYGKNRDGSELYFAYSHVRVSTKWVVLGCIPSAAFPVSVTDWTVPALISIALLVVLMIDVIYFKRSMARELHQKELLRSALMQAEEASQVKSNFLSGMSHDMRTPINGILGMAQVAGKHVENTEKVKSCLHKITRSSRQLLTLINDMLDMSKLESGRAVLTEKEFSMPDLLREFESRSRGEAGSHRHSLVVRTRISREWVIGDRFRIFQVFMILMNNAIRYTPDGGKIQVTISEYPSKKKNYRFYEAVFEDNGIGMKEDFLKKIFEPFARAEDTRISKKNGNGLGLPIAQNILRSMGGDMRVESEWERGSRFTATFFLKISGEMEAEVKVEEPDQKRNEEKQGRSGAERSEDAPKNRRILLVEDNSLNQEIAKELLEMTGVTVECAENGEEAVQRIVSSEDGYYDLVFMDIHMPVMDGYEATRQIRAGDRAYLKKLPIIAVSASAFDEDAYEAKSAGMNDHIAKPLDLEVLTRVLAAWLAPSDPGEQTEICPIKIDNDRNV